MIDPVEILKDLIRCQSVTPHEGGALTYLEKLLNEHGFQCHRLTFSDTNTPDVENLYARWGAKGKNFCFAGHTDVVPVGDLNAWTFDPFAAEIKDGKIYGRGTADMKGGVAAFVAAALNFIKENQNADFSISFLITGDEEGPAINGTIKVLHWLEEKNEKIDFCIVGEPTSKEKLGDMIKIGRRGSFTGSLTVNGKQGHVAYPHLADNPVPKLITLLKTLTDLELDKGTKHFQPSNLEVVNIDIGNKANNVIPAAAHATFNIRFNDQYNGTTLEKKIRDVLNLQNTPYELDIVVGGESFYTPPGDYSNLLSQAIKKITGIEPDLSTTGGTSDARFIYKYTPVIECGLVGATAHQVDEHVSVQDVIDLSDIYTEILRLYT